MAVKRTRRQILQLLADGEITVSQAMRRIADDPGAAQAPVSEIVMKTAAAAPDESIIKAIENLAQSLRHPKVLQIIATRDEHGLIRFPVTVKEAP